MAVLWVAAVTRGHRGGRVISSTVVSLSCQMSKLLYCGLQLHRRGGATGHHVVDIAYLPPPPVCISVSLHHRSYAEHYSDASFSSICGWMCFV